MKRNQEGVWEKWKNSNISYRKPSPPLSIDVAESDRDIEKAAQKLKDQTYESEYDLGFCLQMVRYESQKHKKLIETFLRYPGHSGIRYIALDILCGDLDLTLTYLKEIKEALKDTIKDSEKEGIGYYGDLRELAMSLLQDYFEKHQVTKESLPLLIDKEVLQLLVNIFENPRTWAYFRAKAFDIIALAENCAQGEFEDVKIPIKAGLKYTLEKIEKNRFDLLNPAVMKWAYAELKTPINLL